MAGESRGPSRRPCPPDLRGWEWRYLKAQCNAARLTLHGHTETAWSVAVSPDGRLIASSSGIWGWSRPGEVILWDADSGAQRAVLRGHDGPIMSLDFSPDGSRFASAFTAWGSVLRILDLAKPAAELQQYTYNIDVILGMAYSPEGRRVALSGKDGAVLIVDARSGRELKRLHTHDGPVQDVAFGPDGRTLVTVGHDRTVKTWDARTDWNEDLLHFGRSAKSGDFHRMELSPDGRRLLLPSGLNRSAPGVGERTLVVWDVAGSRIVFRLSGHNGWLTDVAVTRDARRYASASEDGTARVWNADSGESICQLNGHTGAVSGVSFHPLGRVLATCGADGTVRVWNAETGELQRTITAHAGPVADVAIDGNGAWIASAGHDGTIRLFDLPTGREIRALRGHVGTVTTVAFSPDGRLLASSGEDETVRLWDAATGAPVQVLRGHRGIVRDVTFSLDGQRLATAGNDASVKLWDLSSGEEVITFYTPDPMSAVRFHPDGDRLFAAYDWNVQIWNARPRTDPRMDVAFDDANDAWHRRELRQACRDRHASAVPFHARKLVARSLDHPDALLRRGNALGDAEQWELAHQDLTAALQRKVANRDAPFLHMLLLLQLERLDEFRDSLARHLEELGDDATAAMLNNAAWCGALLPDAVEKPAQLVAFAERAVALSDAKDRSMYHNTLAATLLRSGRLDEARTLLEGAVQRRGDQCHVEDLLLLALVHARAGNRQVARRFLERTQSRLATQSATRPSTEPHWTERLARQILLREVLSLLDDGQTN